MLIYSIYPFLLQNLRDLYAGRKSRVWSATFLPATGRVGQPLTSFQPGSRICLKAYLRSALTETDLLKVLK